MYIDPAFAGLFMQVLIGAAAVAGAVWYSIKRKTREILKMSRPVTRISRVDNEEIIDPLEDCNA
ncbi:MAG: hypothetical protein LBE35_11145 [Clostridiales bacterium]|nr:hypothetical protein [Clostridiales bacterium]